jgi:hypothetical protein
VSSSSFYRCHYAVRRRNGTVEYIFSDDQHAGMDESDSVEVSRATPLARMGNGMTILEEVSDV